MEEDQVQQAKNIHLRLGQLGVKADYECWTEREMELLVPCAQMAAGMITLRQEIESLKQEFERLERQLLPHKIPYKRPKRPYKKKKIVIPEGYVTFGQYFENHKDDHKKAETLPNCPTKTYLSVMCLYNPYLNSLRIKRNHHFYIPEDKVFEFMKTDECMKHYPSIRSKYYKAQKGSRKKFS